MPKTFITQSSEETQKLGQMLAQELQSGKIICLLGELGSGKTTFTQGFLKGLGIHGPYTSPTFVVLKHYKVKSAKLKVQSKDKNYAILNIYHADAYRINSKDMINLGWEELISNKKNIIIVEWADRIAGIMPKDSLWIEFKWTGENKRKIILK